MSNNMQVQPHCTMWCSVLKQCVNLLGGIEVSVQDGLVISRNALIYSNMTRLMDLFSQETSCHGVIVTGSRKARRLCKG